MFLPILEGLLQAAPTVDWVQTLQSNVDPVAMTPVHILHGCPGVCRTRSPSTLHHRLEIESLVQHASHLNLAVQIVICPAPCYITQQEQYK